MACTNQYGVKAIISSRGFHSTAKWYSRIYRDCFLHGFEATGEIDDSVVRVSQYTIERNVVHLRVVKIHDRDHDNLNNWSQYQQFSGFSRPDGTMGYDLIARNIHFHLGCQKEELLENYCKLIFSKLPDFPHRMGVDAELTHATADYNHGRFSIEY